MAEIIQFSKPEISYDIDIRPECNASRVHVKELMPFEVCVFISCNSFDELPVLKAEGDKQAMKACHGDSWRDDLRREYR